MDRRGRDINFLELGGILEREFVLMRDVKLTIKYPYLVEVACLVHTAFKVGAKEGLEKIGAHNLGEYLLLLRKENPGAERWYSYCVDFIHSKEIR
jgi:hypothetical protein